MSKKLSLRLFTVLIAGVLAAVIIFPSASSAMPGNSGAIPTTKAFHQFQTKVCRIFRKQNNAAAASVYQFNYYYYNSPNTPENLEAAGSWMQHLYTIYNNYNAGLRSLKAPPGYQRDWHKYNTQENQVLKFGFKAAAALMQANDGLFHFYENKNETWQRNRNTTFSQMALYCG